MKYFTVIVFFILFFTNCTNKDKKVLEISKMSNVEILDNTFNFGNIKVYDTINHVFFLKNISDKKFIIDTVGTSCGCTTTSYTKDSVSKNEIAKIYVKFIADKEDFGKVSKSIVVSDNSQDGYHTFYLKGTVN
mgnify:CR=1 FL=1